MTAKILIHVQRDREKKDMPAQVCAPMQTHVCVATQKYKGNESLEQKVLE